MKKITFIFTLIIFLSCKEKNQVLPYYDTPDFTPKWDIKNKTLFHTIRPFNLISQENRIFTEKDIDGKICVADFFFTRCPTICPGMTQNMKRLAETIHNGQRVGDRTNRNIHFLSFSIDPERDSLQRLRYWANRFQINPETWWLLTGDKKSIYEMAINEMKLGLIDGENVDTNFVHSDKFVLIDINRQVRGYYSGLDPEDLARLQRDIILLTMEKNPNRRSFFEGKLTVMAISFLMAILGVFILLYFLKKNKS